MMQPKPAKEVIEEIRRLLKSGKPDELQDYVKKYPGFIFSYIQVAKNEMEIILTEIEILSVHTTKAITDVILKEHRSDIGGIPVDLSNL